MSLNGHLLVRGNDEMYYYLADKDIEGVYELNIPFDFNFISEWGDVVQPKFSQIGLAQSAL